MIYIVVLLLMFMGVYAYDLRRQKQFFNISYWGLCVILIIIAGLRYRIGTDSVVYEKGYEDVPLLWEITKFNFSSTRYEPGFVMLESVTRSFSDDFMWFQFLHAIIVNVVVFWFILKNTSNRFLCLTFYFIALYLNLNTQVLRESIAVALFLLAWPSFRDGKWLQYYLIVAFALLFHVSATVLLFLPLFCLPGIREAFVFGKRTLIISAVLMVAGLIIQSQFSAFFSLLAVTQTMVDRVHEYSSNVFGTTRLNIFGMVSTILKFCLYPAVALYFLNQQYKIGKRKKLSKMAREERRNYNARSRWEMMVVLGIYFSIFSLTIFIFGRYYNYFGMFCLAAVANWIFSRLRIGKKTYRLQFAYWVAILIPFYLLNFYSYYVPANKSGTLKEYIIYYPYSSRLNPEIDPDREAVYRYLDAR